MEHFATVKSWVTRLILHKNDTPELTLRKKFFLITNLIALLFISFDVVLANILGLKHFVSHVLMLLLFTLFQTILLTIFRKWKKWFIYSVFSIYIVLIFYIIISLGGIANSAGLLMAAYFFLLTAQWMEDTKLLLFVGLLYVAGVLVAGISFPFLQQDQDLAGWKNNLFFAINFGWIGIFIALALYTTLVKGENAAKKREEQLQELDLLKSKLYANIAHELRTPLTMIKGNASEIGVLSENDTYKRAKSIFHNADKILFLVNQMLNLSKVEEGDLPVHYVQSDLVAFVGLIAESFQSHAESRKLVLHYNPLCTALMMDMDADKLEETLSNLLSNAIKYTPEGGEVFVSLRRINPENESGLKVEIRVRDTGIGIPEDQTDKIFKRFYRVEDKRIPYREGTGIGLALVHEYLKMMNGSIQVNSAPEEGSEFIVTLPVTNDAEVADVISLKGNFTRMEMVHALDHGIIESNPGYPHLLIIEDNQELTEYLVDMLKDKYQISTAEDGNRGVKQAISLIPDIILCDVMMPGKDGYQVCRELKHHILTNHIPIMMLTARADIGSRIIGMEQGADIYLTKPFDKKELMVCLQNLFVQCEKLKLKYQTKLYEKLPREVAGEKSVKFLSRIINILEKNYQNEKFRIEHIYMELGISRVQLHRKLSALTGQSTSGFIRSFRLHKAKKLLMGTDRNVSEIAYMVGFTDPNYFSRAFAEENGITPTEFRKSFN